MFPLDHLPQLPNGALLYLILLAIVVGSSVPVVALVILAEPLLVAVVVLATDGHLSIPTLLAVAVGGAVLGDALAYVLGRWFGPKLLGNRVVRRARKHMWSAHRGVQRRGVLGALVVQRWMPPARGFVPALLGSARHSFGRFVISSAVAALLWGFVIVVGTYVCGPTLVIAIPTVTGIVMAIRVGRPLLSRLLERTGAAARQVTVSTATQMNCRQDFGTLGSLGRIFTLPRGTGSIRARSRKGAGTETASGCPVERLSTTHLCDNGNGDERPTMFNGKGVRDPSEKSGFGD